jgi:hypothetical protein
MILIFFSFQTSYLCSAQPFREYDTDQASRRQVARVSTTHGLAPFLRWRAREAGKVTFCEWHMGSSVRRGQTLAECSLELGVRGYNLYRTEVYGASSVLRCDEYSDKLARNLPLVPG